MRNANPIGKLLVAPSSKIHSGKDIPGLVANRAKQTVPKYRELANTTVRPRKNITGVIILIKFRRQVIMTPSSNPGAIREDAQQLRPSWTVSSYIPSGFIPHSGGHTRRELP
jgi:hypothetical protein